MLHLEVIHHRAPVELSIAAATTRPKCQFSRNSLAHRETSDLDADGSPALSNASFLFICRAAHRMSVTEPGMVPA
jgi:hypothetical protein